MQQKEYLKVIAALAQFRSVTVSDLPCFHNVPARELMAGETKISFTLWLF